MNKRNIRWRGRGPALGASAGVVLAVLAGTALPGAAGAATSRPAAKSASVGPAVTVSADPLGVDVAPWDTLFSNPATLGTVESYLRAAGVTELHYGGGGTADQFDEQTNTVVNDCGANPTVADFTAPCAKTESLDFAHFSADARSLGAQTFATVNYGTGDPAMAANWVTQSLQSGQQVAQWSIGNESYGCWEADDWLLGAPVDDTAYAPDYHAGCPMVYEPTAAAGMTDMADSYAQNALPYMQQMKAADPSIKIGVPWAFDYHVGGASVANNYIWNDTILGKDGPYISFVEAHWYPFSFGGDMGADGNKTAQQVIQSVTTIPADYKSIRQTLSTYDPNATVTVGETGVSYLATNTPCTPTGALFSAGDALEWLAAGAQTVNWWPLETGANNGSSCTVPEEGMFTGNGTPDTAYTGYLLASELAQPNARLSPMTVPNLSNPSDTADTFGFQSVLPDGQTVVALFNANTASAQTVSVGSSLTGSVATQTYSAGHQNGSDSLITDGRTTAGAVAGGISLPAQSIVILKSQLPSKVTLGASATLVKAGTKVQLRGQVTLNGAAAPARIAVKIYRRAAGSSANLATLTATTTAGGAFAVTDLPAKYGHYNYVVSYGGTSLYVAASASIPVRVIALQPTLKLKFSAGTVKAGRKVTVTATLAGWHNNHTLVIYAQPAGSARKMIARASTNARGQLVVSFTMKKNTTFTVTYGGDWWYGAASARGIVKI